MEGPQVIRKDELAQGQPTAGMIRREAFASDTLWVGTATTEPGAVSGWHHHGEHDSYVYCVKGAFRVESGRGGQDVAEARAGDFMRIPPGMVHRESNPTGEEQHLVVTRIGRGPVVVNVDGPVV